MYAVHNQYDFFVTELHADAKLREKFLRMMLKWYQGSSIITQFNQKYNYIILDISFHTHALRYGIILFIYKYGNYQYRKSSAFIMKQLI